MRLACKKWRDELDACTYLLVPSVCNAHQILQRFSHLHELDLSSCALTVRDECLETLAGMKKLQSIDLRGCVKVNPDPHSPLTILKDCHVAVKQAVATVQSSETEACLAGDCRWHQEAGEVQDLDSHCPGQRP